MSRRYYSSMSYYYVGAVCNLRAIHFLGYLTNISVAVKVYEPQCQLCGICGFWAYRSENSCISTF